MKIKLYTLSIIFLLVFEINAQTEQAAVAICGWDGSSGDKVLFVALRDFSPGEIIYFTEDEYSIASGNFDMNEGHVAYTVGAGGLAENEVSGFEEISGNTFAVLCGASGTAIHVAGTGNWSFSNVDEFYAYSASNPASPWSSITDIHCFSYAAVVQPPADQEPAGDYPNVIVIKINIGSSGGMNANFLDANRTNTTIPQLQNTNNWFKSTGAISFTCTDFTNHLLPIELISFDAKEKNNGVELRWATATEINNEFFDIEHSVDGRTFNKVLSTKGGGNTYEKEEYAMTHDSPVSGTNYYRLKQTDFDGAYTYSDIASVTVNKRDRISSVFPNPFENQLTIALSDTDYSIDKTIKIEIYDNLGKLVLSKETQSDIQNVTLDLSSLDQGIYFMKYVEGNLLLNNMQRIVKM